MLYYYVAKRWKSHALEKAGRHIITIIQEAVLTKSSTVFLYYPI